MICFALDLNGRRLAVAGVPGFACLTACLTWVAPKPRHGGGSSLNLHLGGLDANSESDDGTHLNWVNQDVKVGDRITLKILEREVSGPPRTGRATMTPEQLAADRVRSAAHYLKEYKRQRVVLDRQIRAAEKVLATAKKERSPRRPRTPRANR